MHSERLIRQDIDNPTLQPVLVAGWIPPLKKTPHVIATADPMPWKQGLSLAVKVAGIAEENEFDTWQLAAVIRTPCPILSFQSNLYFVFGVSCGDELIVKRHAGLLRWKEDIKELLK